MSEASNKDDASVLGDKTDDEKEKNADVETKNKSHSFAKLNRGVVIALHELWDLIDDMKQNLLPRHEMLLYLHKIVENLSALVDLNKADDEDTDEGDEENAQVPKEVQNWIQQTFMHQEEKKLGKNASSDSFNIFTKFQSKKTCIKQITNDIGMPDDAVFMMENDKLWQFNIFIFDEITYGHALKYALYFYLQRYNYFNFFKIPLQTFDNLMNHIEYGYERYKNPYHNKRHACDVLHTSHCLLILNGMLTKMSFIELFSVLFAAAIHDYDHQGVTNNFIVENKYQLSLTYNDVAVQENHHVSAFFKLLRKPFLNVTVNLNKEQFNEFRALCIKMVLATDMSSHFVQLKKYNGLIANNEQIKIADYLSNLVHTADLSNPAKEWSIACKWVIFIFYEFFAQGDKERALGVPISPLCDRRSTMIAQSQIGFIDFIIQPTFDLFSNITETFLAQQKVKDPQEIISRKNKKKNTFQLAIQYNHCLNRPWEICIMQNRANWRRKGDKDYQLMKTQLEADQEVVNSQIDKIVSEN